MPYTLTFDLNLGLPGLTLQAQLIDTTGATVGGAVTTGFVEIGNGFYMFTHTAIPDGHRGGVTFQNSGGGGPIRGFRSVNPEEAENMDAKITSRATATEVWDEVLEGTFTAKELTRLRSAAVAGEASGLDGATAAYKAVGNSAKTRISMGVDADGNRASAVYDLSD